MSIGERIAALRKKQGISQGQLASMLDISRQAVSKWENDLSCPDSIKLIQLADVLNTEVEFLATGRMTPPSSPSAYANMPVIIEKPVAVEKIVEVERIVEVEKPVVVEKYVEKPVFRKIIRYKYLRNPFEYIGISIISGLIGYLIGIFS